jgi:hypothetical protein
MPARSSYGFVNRLNPEAAARCDRGGEIRKRSELLQEMRWQGDRLVPTGFLCCAKHIDPPNPQDRTVRLRADPVPVRQPRLDIDLPASRDPVVGTVLVTESLFWLTTESGEVLVA